MPFLYSRLKGNILLSTAILIASHHPVVAGNERLVNERQLHIQGMPGCRFLIGLQYQRFFTDINFQR